MMSMQDGFKLYFNEKAKFMYHDKQVIICNRLTGMWIKIPMEYYEIIKLGVDNKLNAEELLERLYDDEDRRIIRKAIEKLDSLGVLYPYVSNNEWHELSLALTAQCNL